jgi:hypothetical protein
MAGFLECRKGTTSREKKENRKKIETGALIFNFITGALRFS